MRVRDPGGGSGDVVLLAAEVVKRPILPFASNPRDAFVDGGAFS